jgi:hypothetical protein
MQINWDATKQLKGTRSDVWILIPAGVAINRLLDKKKQLANKEKLEKFFGLSIDIIEGKFYKSSNEETLFGKEEITKKIKNPIDKIIDIYVKQLRTVWTYVTENPLVLTNSKTVRFFIFFLPQIIELDKK